MMSLYEARERAKEKEKRATNKQATYPIHSSANKSTKNNELISYGRNTDIGYLENHGKKLIQNGYSIIPILPGKKRSGLSAWQNIKSTSTMVNNWLKNGYKNGGIGVLAKNNPAIDIDIRDPEIVKKVVDFVSENFKATVYRTGQSPKCLTPFRTDKPFKKMVSRKFESPDGKKHQVELLGDGQQFVAYGIHPETNSPYTYSDHDLLSVKSDDLPELTLEGAKKIISYFESIIPESWIVADSNTPKIHLKTDAIEVKGGNTFSIKRPPKLKRHLNLISPDDYSIWIKVGMGISNEYDNSNEGLILWDEWSQKSQKYKGRQECEKKWHSFKKSNDGRSITAGSIINMARQNHRIQLCIEDVYEKLEQNKKEGVQKNLKNVTQILEYDQNIGLVQFDELKQAEVIDGRASEDKDVLLTKSYIYDNYHVEFGTNQIHEALVIVAHNNTFNPVTRYLDSLTWDCENRLEIWLTDHACAEDNEYVRAVSAKTLVAAVARAYDPGCKYDTMLVLEGEQGIGKSSLIAALVPDNEWFSDTELNIGHKDAFQQLQGIWIQEMGEMAGATKSDIKSLKAFLSSKSDNFRSAYARKNQVVPRRVIFIGTTNDDHYLRDETGGRRFWPVRVSNPDVKWVYENRDQLWAEAKTRYESGEKLYLDKDLEKLAYAEQDKRFIHDAWEEPIKEFLVGVEKTTVADICNIALGIQNKDIDRRVQNRISLIMRALGWKSKTIRIEGRAVRGYAANP
jgi:predicted P-loop ATPase